MEIATPLHFNPAYYEGEGDESNVEFGVVSVIIFFISVGYCASSPAETLSLFGNRAVQLFTVLALHCFVLKSWKARVGQKSW